MNSFQDNELIYLPATNSLKDSDILYPFGNINLEHKKQCSWWSHNPLFPYNAMLVSAFYGMNEIKNRREIRDEVLFFGDSGGFQILQEKMGIFKDKNLYKKLTWQKVIEWQLEVCDVGMTLDIPTPRVGYLINDKKIFEENLKISKKNALEMLKYKNNHIEEAHNPDFKLFNCIHGADCKDMERWHKETTENYNVEYDGFSLSTGKYIPYLLPLRLGFAIEYSKGKPFHLLGVSSPQLIPLIAYANTFTNTQIYFDSSSFSFGKRYRSYKLMWDFSYSGIKLSEKQKIRSSFTLTCPCPVCSQLNNPEELSVTSVKSGTLISLHNLYWFTYYTGFFNGLVYFPKQFRAHVKRLSRSAWILKCMEFLDYVNETDLNTAWNKYGESIKKTYQLH